MCHFICNLPTNCLWKYLTKAFLCELCVISFVVLFSTCVACVYLFMGTFLPFLFSMCFVLWPWLFTLFVEFNFKEFGRWKYLWSLNEKHKQKACCHLIIIFFEMKKPSWHIIIHSLALIISKSHKMWRKYGSKLFWMRCLYLCWILFKTMTKHDLSCHFIF